NDRVAATGLKPEFTTSMEAGLEMQFFRSRLTANVNVYQTNSTDQIVPINIAASSGAQSIWTNIGEVENQGVEVDLSGKIFNNQDFSWDVGINYTAMRSEVVSLADGVDRVDIGGYTSAQIVAEIG